MRVGYTRLSAHVGKCFLNGIDEALFGDGADQAVYDVSIVDEQERWQALYTVDVAMRTGQREGVVIGRA